MPRFPRPAHAAAAASCLILLALALAPALRTTPSPAPEPLMAAAASPSTIVSAPASAPPATASGPAAVQIEAGEAPAAVVVHWDPGDATGPAAVDLYDATAAVASAPPLLSVPVAAGRSGVAVLGLAAERAYQAVVTVTGGAVGARRIGPSPVFRLGPQGPVVAAGPGGEQVTGGSVRADGPGCLGAGYGLGAVSVDGWAGVQGAYCEAPAFSTGTGSFCVDHGLDYPAGGYGWAPTVVGAGAALVNQYGRPADPSSVQRLAWVVAQYGGTPDPARAVAVGVIVHAVMGDYPGLSTADLDPARFAVTGGDPAAITADVASMWASSARLGGPYVATLHVAAGPYVIGRTYRGSVGVAGRSGVAVPGVAISLGASTGALVSLDPPGSTGPDGSVGFSFRPSAATFTLGAATGPLPADSLTLWSPLHAPVPVQRVVAPGPPAVASATVRLAAAAPAQATLVKVSSDPTAVPVGTGFGFDVALAGSGGTWTVVAHRTTAANGSMEPVTGLDPGTYRVTETVHPQAFSAGGPWTFTLVAGQQARWEMTDTVVPQPVRVVKVGDDTPAVPIGAGVVFALSSDTAGDGGFATAAGTLTTGPGGITPTVELPPGRYRLAETTPPAGYQPAPPVPFTVPPVGAGGPLLQTVTVTNHAVPGTIRLVKTDAATGAALPGAVLHVDRLAPTGAPVAAGDWTSGGAPVDVTLAPGRYLVSEVHPPAGYRADAGPQQVALQPGQTLEVTFTDRPLAVAVPAPPSVGLSPGSPVRAAPAPAATPGPALAFTGLPVWRWLLAAGAALGAGATLVRGARRRPAGAA